MYLWNRKFMAEFMSLGLFINFIALNRDVRDGDGEVMTELISGCGKYGVAGEGGMEGRGDELIEVAVKVVVKIEDVRWRWWRRWT